MARIPQGTLVISRDGRLVRGLVADFAVGDLVSSTVLSPSKVIDRKLLRKPVPLALPGTNLKVINPRGHVTINSFTFAGVRGVLEVVGEEDLLVLPVALKNEGATIAYGQPGAGVVILRASSLRARRLLKIYKPCILVLPISLGMLDEQLEGDQHRRSHGRGGAGELQPPNQEKGDHTENQPSGKGHAQEV
ncbi:MAG: DUF359 domain-containing protein [Desulfurococcaceae archaeon]